MTDPSQLPDEIVQEMRRPEGTLTFSYESEQLFDATVEGKLLEIVVGAHVFRLTRDSDLNLNFVHASPGTGTRIASLPLAEFRDAQGIVVYLIWSPDVTRLVVGDKERKIGLREAKGAAWERQLHALADGTVLEVGGPGVEVFGVRIQSGSQVVHEPTAHEAWVDTLRATKTLLTGTSDIGYMFEVVQANFVIVMLVTGFEAYCQARFGEIEREGVTADFEALAAKFDRIKRAGGKQALEKEATVENTTPSAVLTRDLNFQDYTKCKDAYRHGYGIRFADLAGVSSDEIRTLKQTIRFRHRIIHVSPLIGTLSQSEVPPVFSNRAHAERSIELFEHFIRALHGATLQLRPS